MSHSYLTPLSGTPRHLHARAALIDAYHRTGDTRYLQGYSDDQPAIPAVALNPDTAHAADWTIGGVIGTSVEAVSNGLQSLLGGVSQGIGKGLGASFGFSEQTTWLIVGGIVLYLVMQKKGRR